MPQKGSIIIAVICLRMGEKGLFIFEVPKRSHSLGGMLSCTPLPVKFCAGYPHRVLTFRAAGYTMRIQKATAHKGLTEYK